MDTSARMGIEPQTALPEEDALDSLEERIHRTVELVTALRAERDAALAELDRVRKASGSAITEAQKLRQELEGLRSERKQVRTRIEKLLGQMELLP
jgi:FtsZ-binding cell division protein ZapB